jgi:tetratricopeptide (TPR) repeat protein
MDLYDRGHIDEAYKINKMVEKLLDRQGHPKISRLRADILVIIGLCSDFMAITKRQEGLEIRQQCVEIREQCYAQIKDGDVTLDDKILLYNSYTDLVCSQQQINDFEGARKNLELCFERYQEWGTEDDIPYEYSKYYNQMAYVLLHENDCAKAVEFAKKGYELVEQATPGALIVVLYKLDYTNILFQQGEQLEALDTLQQLLEICERDCGKDNVLTLGVRLNVGIVCYFLGRADDAQ